MENNENFVTDTEEVVTEKVEETTEETPAAKTYTEEELNARVNEIVGKRVARKEAKIRKEYESKYGDLEGILRAGTGKENVEEITETFRDHYVKRGVNIPTKPTYSDRDISILAAAEADDIIDAGYEEVVEEVDRLAEKGIGNMTAKEKAVFKRLAEYRKSTEESRELSSIGVTKEEYDSAEFKAFAKKFAPGTSIKDVYDIYRQTKPKKEIKNTGSLKQPPQQDNGVKDYYSPEEASKFTRRDYDKNPDLFRAVKASMAKWGKK